MTKEEIKNICKIYDNFRRERDATTIAYNSEDTFWAHILTTYNLSKPSLPSNLDDAADKYVQTLCDRADDNLKIDTTLQAAFKAGAKWMARQES